MKNSLILGTTDIGEYITPAIEEEAGGIKQVIQKLEKRGLEHEKGVIKSLERNYLNFKYSQVDLSFLGMSNKIKMEVPTESIWSNTPKYKLSEISVPKFSVYKLYGDNKFTMEFDPDFMGSYSDREFSEKSLNVIFEKGEFDEIIYENLARVFKNEGLNLERIRKQDWSGKVTMSFVGKKKDLMKYGTWRANYFVIGSQFDGLIPEITIEKIRRAGIDFRKEHIYIITETQPKEWTAEYRTNDPLIIGIDNKDTYLIDHFNTTPLENIVKDGFTKSNFN